MKGGAVAPAAKRRWKAVALALVLALVAVSFLVPLGVLVGFQSKLARGYSAGDRLRPGSGFGNFGRSDGGRAQSQLEEDGLKINYLIKRLGPSIPKAEGDVDKKNNGRVVGDGSQSDLQRSNADSHSDSKNTASHLKGSPNQQAAPSRSHPTPNTKDGGGDRKKHSVKGSDSEVLDKLCQLQFGTYCLWSIEHKEVMKDSTVKKLKDQLFVARAYYPSIAKLKEQDKLSRDLKQNIQEYERMLNEAISDADLPSFVERRIQKMDRTIARAKACVVDCNNVDKKLRQLLDLTEDEAHFHMKQSAFLYHLGVQTMPKGLHCLSMRSTVEYFRSSKVDADRLHGNKFNSPSFRHFVIFSRNIIAASVAVNSTVVNSKETGNIVFHIVTDGQNYYAMKMWFGRNSFKDVAISILNIDDLKLKSFSNLGLPQLSMSEEFRVVVRNTDQPSLLNLRTEYISVFGHSHFLLPQIFKNLKKVIVLDEDVVIQRDLSSLWDLNLEGKVNGAVEYCGVRLSQLKSYFGSNTYNGNSCVWMSGLNIIDLEKWREHNVTENYRRLIKRLQFGSKPTRTIAALPASLLTFDNLIYALDDSWVLSGLGHDYGISLNVIKQSVALHYNGNMKPWLELGIPRYKKYWKNFLTRGDQFLEQCNVNP